MSVDTYKCNLCGKCQDVCPSSALAINEKDISLCIDYTNCMYCNYCVMTCPNNALSFSNEFEGAARNKDIFTHCFNIINVDNAFKERKK